MKKILCISDLHCGDLVAVMPKEVHEDVSGRTHTHFANPLQLEMLDCWNNMVKKVGKVDTVFNIGDNINGSNYHDSGLGNWTNNLMTQSSAAYELLNRIKCSNHNMVIGSKYHVGTNPSAEHGIANLMRLDGDTVNVGKDLIVKVGGKTFHLLHEIGFSKNMSYRTTPLSRELMFMSLHSEKLYGAQYIVRGHTHYYANVNFPSTGGVIVPGWKLRDDFAKKGGLGGTDLRIGYVLIKIKGDKVSFEYDGVKFMANTEVVEV